MADSCPFANKQWNALNRTCWRQDQNKHEDDALDLPCVPGVGNQLLDDALDLPSVPGVGNQLLCFLRDVHFFSSKSKGSC